MNDCVSQLVLVVCSDEIGNFAYRGNLIPPYKSALKVYVLVVYNFYHCQPSIHLPLVISVPEFYM